MEREIVTDTYEELKFKYTKILVATYIFFETSVSRHFSQSHSRISKVH